MTIENRSARSSVQGRQVFKANNLFSEHVPTKNGEVYVVYSYGRHWPLFAYISGTWYENEDKYSPTTSKHRSQSHPKTDTVKLSLSAMKDLIYTGTVTAKVA